MVKNIFQDLSTICLISCNKNTQNLIPPYQMWATKDFIFWDSCTILPLGREPWIWSHSGHGCSKWSVVKILTVGRIVILSIQWSLSVWRTVHNPVDRLLLAVELSDRITLYYLRKLIQDLHQLFLPVRSTLKVWDPANTVFWAIT